MGDNPLHRESSLDAAKRGYQTALGLTRKQDQLTVNYQDAPDHPIDYNTPATPDTSLNAPT